MTLKSTLAIYIDGAQRDRKSEQTERMRLAMEQAVATSADIITFVGDARREGLEVSYRIEPPKEIMGSIVGVLGMPSVDRFGTIINAVYEINFGPHGYGSDFYAYPQSERPDGSAPLNSGGKYRAEQSWDDMRRFMRQIRSDVVEALMAARPLPEDIIFPEAVVF